MEKFYKYKDIKKILGIKQTRLHAWVERGYIKPSIKGKGSGTQNIYTLNDLFKIAYFQGLVEFGMSRASAAKIVKDFDLTNLLITETKIMQNIKTHTLKHFSKIYINIKLNELEACTDNV